MLLTDNPVQYFIWLRRTDKPAPCARAYAYERGKVYCITGATEGVSDFEPYQQSTWYKTPQRMLADGYSQFDTAEAAMAGTLKAMAAGTVSEMGWLVDVFEEALRQEEKQRATHRS